MPEFYDDYGTTGTIEFVGNSLTFGSYNAKKITRYKSFHFTIIVEKFPSNRHNVKKGEQVPMNIYSEAIQCWRKDLWWCGLNSLDHVIHHHATRADLKDKNFSIYGVGGRYFWVGPYAAKVW